MKKEMTMTFLNQEFMEFKLFPSFYIHIWTIVRDYLECFCNSTLFLGLTSKLAILYISQPFTVYFLQFYAFFKLVILYVSHSFTAYFFQLYAFFNSLKMDIILKVSRPLRQSQSPIRLLSNGQNVDSKHAQKIFTKSQGLP